MAPARRICGWPSIVQATTVEGTPPLTGPSSMIRATSSARDDRTCAAVVASGWPEMLAELTAIGPSAAPIPAARRGRADEHQSLDLPPLSNSGQRRESGWLRQNQRQRTRPEAPREPLRHEWHAGQQPDLLDRVDEQGNAFVGRTALRLDQAGQAFGRWADRQPVDRFGRDGNDGARQQFSGGPFDGSRRRWQRRCGSRRYSRSMTPARFTRLSGEMRPLSRSRTSSASADCALPSEPRPLRPAL